MLVRDVIQGMQAGALTGKMLAEQYGVSARTISKRISSLGYKYDNVNKTYSFTGSNEDLVAVEAQDFGSLFDPIKKATAVTATAVTPKAKQVPATAKPTAVTPKPKAVKAVTPELDNIDKLFLQAERPARIYRGYYFDADILAVIDRASNKSALINEALRRVFAEKGLL